MLETEKSLVVLGYSKFELHLKLENNFYLTWKLFIQSDSFFRTQSVFCENEVSKIRWRNETHKARKRITLAKEEKFELKNTIVEKSYRKS